MPTDIDQAFAVAEATALKEEPDVVHLESKAEEPKAEEPKAEEPKAEEPKAEEPKAEEPKAEEPKAEEPKAEEPKAEEPKAEEPQTFDELTEEERALIARARQRKELTARIGKLNSYLAAEGLEKHALDADAVEDVDQAVVKLLAVVLKEKTKSVVSPAQTSDTVGSITTSAAADFFRGLN